MAVSQETHSAEVDINIDEMRRTNHISLARVAANGAASAPQRAPLMLTAQGRSRRTAPPEEFNEILMRCVAMASRGPLKANATFLCRCSPLVPR